MERTIIAHITDCHIDESFIKEQGIDSRKNWITLLDDIQSRGIQEIVFGGDIGESSAYPWFFDSLSAFNLHISPGNHDSVEHISRFFTANEANNNSELYSSLDFNNHRCIFLDSSTELISEEQFNWFASEIKSGKIINLFIHHPILPMDAVIDKRFHLIGRDKIRNALIDLKTNVNIFSGHYHMEEYIKTENINQYITPACSYQVIKHPSEIILSSEQFGYRIITFEEDEVTTEVILFDSANHK